MMLAWSLPLALTLLSLNLLPKCTADDDSTQFISPADDSTVVWELGSTRTVSWRTDCTSRYVLDLYLDPPGGHPQLAGLIDSFAPNDGDLQSITWAVSGLSRPEAVPGNFYFMLEGANVSLASHPFIITNSVTSSNYTFSADPATNPTSSPSSASAKTTLRVGVGLGVGLPLIIIVGAYFGLKARRRYQSLPPPYPPMEQCQDANHNSQTPKSYPIIEAKEMSTVAEVREVDATPVRNCHEMGGRMLPSELA